MPISSKGHIICVPQKRFGSADYDTTRIYPIYLFLCTQKADPNPFRGTLLVVICLTIFRCPHYYFCLKKKLQLNLVKFPFYGMKLQITG